MTNSSREDDPYRIGNGDRLLAGVITLGLAAGLVRVSFLNDGALLAPGFAGLLLIAVLLARKTLEPGQGRSILSALAVGLGGLVILFTLGLLLLLIALNHRGE
jgi:hypothetical protein